MPRRRNALLAVASLVFYAYGANGQVFLLLACIAVNYVAGARIEATTDVQLRNAILAATVVADVGVLAHRRTPLFRGPVVMVATRSRPARSRTRARSCWCGTSATSPTPPTACCGRRSSSTACSKSWADRGSTRFGPALHGGEHAPDRDAVTARTNDEESVDASRETGKGRASLGAEP